MIAEFSKDVHITNTAIGVKGALKGSYTGSEMP